MQVPIYEYFKCEVNYFGKIIIIILHIMIITRVIGSPRLIPMFNFGPGMSTYLVCFPKAYLQPPTTCKPPTGYNNYICAPDAPLSP